MDIKNRLEHVMKTKNITAAQLADELEIQRSGISHILSGRNKPSMDFLIKLKDAYPEFSLDWLVLGKGSATISPTLSPKPRQTDLFGSTFIDEAPVEEHKQEDKAIPAEMKSSLTSREFQSTGNAPQETSPQPKALDSSYKSESKENASEQAAGRHLAADAAKKVVKVVFIYEDQTFSVYSPSIT